MASLARDLLRRIAAGQAVDASYVLGFAQAVQHLQITELASQVLAASSTTDAAPRVVRLASAVASLTRALADRTPAASKAAGGDSAGARRSRATAHRATARRRS